MIAVRYADDVALGFQYEEEARKYTTELGERLSRFGCDAPRGQDSAATVWEASRTATEAAREREARDVSLSGFTHICGRDRRVGLRCCVERKERGRSQKLREVKKGFFSDGHLPIPEQGEWLASVIRGHATCLRGAQQRRPSLRIQMRRAAALVSSAPATKPAKPTELGEDAEADSAVPPSNPHHAPLARGALHPPTPKVRAQCASCARWDPCGGGPTPRELRAVPTATVQAKNTPRR